MADMTQLNTRIDAEVKRRGDAVFARAGLTSSQVVRAVWQSAADTQQVPTCVLPREDVAQQHKLETIARGAGLATKMMAEMGFTPISEGEPFDYKSYRDQMYDEMIEEMEARRVRT